MKKKYQINLRISEEDNKIFNNNALLINKTSSEAIRESSKEFLPNETNVDFEGLYKRWESGEKEKAIDVLYSYYRRYGYPHTLLNKEEKVSIMEQLIKTPSPLLEDNLLQQNTLGLNLANSFHPHMCNVKYTNGKEKTPLQMFKSDKKLKDCINRTMELKRVPNITNMRKMFKTRDGSRSVSNFKPVIARYIYDTYAREGSSVLDISSGFSGRLIGAIASNRNLHYVGIDPHEKTSIGNMKCASFFANQFNEKGEKKFKFNFSFNLGCAEDVMSNLESDKYDCIFSSPPYFHIERYSELPNQSFVKFKTYDEWMNGFLYKSIKESHRTLKKERYLIINIKDYDEYPISSDMTKFCLSNGFLLEKTYKMKLANREFHLGKKAFQTEPIFVFKKI